MAKTKQGGSTKLGRDSISKRLGVKLYQGQRAYAGNVLIRQRGTKYYPGKNVQKGGDDTLYAATDGTVAFRKKPKKNFNGKRRLITLIDILPSSTKTASKK